MELIINRKRWARGEGEGLLLSGQTDKMCCLGFAGRACGIPKKYLNGAQMPSDVLLDNVKQHQDFWGKLATTYADSGGVFNSDIACELADINDRTEINDEMREAQIIRKFKKLGVTVKFKN